MPYTTQIPFPFYAKHWKDNLEQRLLRYAYFPFGAGPRVCIGKAFSMMGTTLILAMIAQKFHLTLLTQHPMVGWAMLTLKQI